MSSRKFSTLHLQNVITTIIVIEVFTMSSELDQELIAKLEMADTRSENAEMDIGRLNVRIDKVTVGIIGMGILSAYSVIMTVLWQE